jgi:hypothetical protein
MTSPRIGSLAAPRAYRVGAENQPPERGGSTFPGAAARLVLRAALPAGGLAAASWPGAHPPLAPRVARLNTPPLAWVVAFQGDASQVPSPLDLRGRERMTDAWHPRCTALRAEGSDGERVCGYTDLTVTALVAEPDEWLRAWTWTWTCPACGGTRFEWVPGDDSVA